MSAGCTLLSFQRPLRLCGGTRRLLRMGRHRANPRRTREYSAAAALCLEGSGAGTHAAEAALADLQDAAVQRRRLEVESPGRNRLSVELHAALAQ